MNRSWYERFEQAILGIDAEKLEKLDFGDDTSCVLGCWLYGAGKSRYGGWPAYESLQSMHRQFHREAQEIIDLFHAANVDGAEHHLHTTFPASYAGLERQLNELRCWAK